VLDQNAGLELRIRSRKSFSTYVKPFEVFAKGSEAGDWPAALDDFRNWLIRKRRES
jgi:hypothetical protein